MAKFSRVEVINKMWDTGLVPLFYHNELQIVKNVVKACYDGGARVFEFTSRGDFAFEIFRDLNKYALPNYLAWHWGLAPLPMLAWHQTIFN
jgi:2-dehydro-3-deoxyphosphogluconate aldolase/(4S)-4-hydroxy-2-oxoglutarate aldolase